MMTCLQNKYKLHIQNFNKRQQKPKMLYTNQEQLSWQRKLNCFCNSAKFCISTYAHCNINFHLGEFLSIHQYNDMIACILFVFYKKMQNDEKSSQNIFKKFFKFPFFKVANTKKLFPVIFASKYVIPRFW